MSIPHHSTHATALTKLLSSGVTRTEAARALGISPSAVTQLAPPTSPTSPEHQQLDSQYDRIEQKLLDQLERTVPLLMRPREISEVLSRINAAKRRGLGEHKQSTPSVVVTLNLPTSIKNKFILNQSNQVVQAGKQELVTIQSANVHKLAESHNALPAPAQTDEFGFTYPERQTESTGVVVQDNS